MNELDFNYTPDEGELIYTGNPRTVMGDCKVGQFKTGATGFIGSEIEIEVVAARVIEAELFGYPFQKWLQLVFVDGNRFICSTLLKTESMDNFLELYRQSLLEGNPRLPDCKVRAMMSPRSNEKGSFYAIMFKVIGEGDYSEQIKQFNGNRPSALFMLTVNNTGNDGAKVDPETGEVVEG